MAMYLEPTFPLRLSYGSTTTPMFSTQITGSKTGWEDANIDWESSRNEFNAAMLVQTQQNLDDFNEFFHAMHGQGNRFKFLDWGDYKSCGVASQIAFNDQIIVSNAVQDQNNILLTKTYTDKSGTHSSIKDITQPITDTVKIGRGSDIGSLVETTEFTIVDGKVVLNTNLNAGEVVSAGFHFYLPMRFAVDKGSTNLSAFRVGEITIPVIEIRVDSE